MKLISVTIAATAFAASLLGGVPAGIDVTAAKDKSLYDRLGGYDAIAAVTDEFIGRLAADDKLRRFFIGFSTDSKQRIRQHVIDLICSKTGGPCIYTGRDMKTAHAGAGITKSDWDRSTKLFGETLAKFKVPDREQKELGAIITPLEKDIVEGS